MCLRLTIAKVYDGKVNTRRLAFNATKGRRVELLGYGIWVNGETMDYKATKRFRSELKDHRRSNGECSYE